MAVSPPLPNPSLNQQMDAFARRALLPLRSDILWRIETGVVRTLTIQEDGNTIILGVWGPGDVVGRVLSKADPYQIECITQVAATPLLEKSWPKVTEEMISHIQRSGELIEILHCRQADASILRLFAWLAQRFGQEVEQGKLIDLRLTHQDIADMLSLTRVTVTRLLKDFEKQGIIHRAQRQFIIVHDQQPYWHYEI